MSEPRLVRACGRSHAGQVREQNEDSLLVDPDLGLFAVFDGMGGHHAGEVASACARDVVHAQLSEAAAGGRIDIDTMVAALQAASAAVHEEALRRKARRGIGTTAVVCQLVAGGRALIAHTGDSRAYLLREGRLQQLTADHTIVAELLAKGAIDPEEAVRHPYRSVLSRNLGARSETRPDVREIVLAPGDRLLLCSDGLTGFADHQAIEHTLRAAGAPDVAAQELVQLALRGGGGDNVTAVVIEAGAAELPRRTQILRTTGADAWWSRRERFFAEARARGVPESPLCAVLSPDEAIEIVAGNLCEAIYRDLEQMTGLHVWTYADNLATGWIAQEGPFDALRELLDRLREAADAVVADLAADDAVSGPLLAVAVPRALLVAELAIGGALARALREVEDRLAAAEGAHTGVNDAPTIPVQVPRADPPPPEVSACLDAAIAAIEGEPDVITDIVRRAHAAAVEHGGHLDGAIVARELFGQRALQEAAVAPLLDALDRARRLHLSAIKTANAAPETRAAALRRVVTAHRELMTATARVLVEVGRPISDRISEVAAMVATLRDKVRINESRLVKVGRRLQTQPGWPAPRREDEP